MLYGYWPDSTRFTTLASTLHERKRIHKACGCRIGAGWRPPQVEVRRESKRPLGDFPLLWIGTPVFSERALEALTPLLGDAIEPLPMKIADQMYYVLCDQYPAHCGLPRSGAIKSDEKLRDGSSQCGFPLCLREDAVANHHIFKIPELGDTKVFISAAFREKTEPAGLVGLQFMKLR